MTTDCLPHQATREARAVIEQLLTNTVREAARRAKKRAKVERRLEERRDERLGDEPRDERRDEQRRGAEAEGGAHHGAQHGARHGANDPKGSDLKRSAVTSESPTVSAAESVGRGGGGARGGGGGGGRGGGGGGGGGGVGVESWMSYAVRGARALLAAMNALHASAHDGALSPLPTGARTPRGDGAAGEPSACMCSPRRRAHARAHHDATTLFPTGDPCGGGRAAAAPAAGDLGVRDRA